MFGMAGMISGRLVDRADDDDKIGARRAADGVGQKKTASPLDRSLGQGKPILQWRLPGGEEAYGMRSSMSRKAECWDNAPTESLWGSLKRDRLHGKRFETRAAAQAEVMDWLAFYNATRLHSTLGYVSPMQHERNWLAAQDKKSAYQGR